MKSGPATPPILDCPDELSFVDTALILFRPGYQPQPWDENLSTFSVAFEMLQEQRTEMTPEEFDAYCWHHAGGPACVVEPLLDVWARHEGSFGEGGE
jgi:hypothetical protein